MVKGVGSIMFVESLVQFHDFYISEMLQEIFFRPVGKRIGLWQSTVKGIVIFQNIFGHDSIISMLAVT